jgi:ring-1,2-phenylacetyl-CoA epoxidase subunit PaaC
MPSVEIDPRIRTIVSYADDNMILAQRLGEWISRAPDLEIDIALGNIALDHLGVARVLYTHAGRVEGEGRTEDDFAMRRSEREFLNLLLVEQPNGDFSQTIVRQFLFDVYQGLVWEDLTDSDDETLAGVAARARKEAVYHHEFSSSWLVRLGDGTEESHGRAQRAVDSLWRYTAELAGPYFEAWRARVDEIFAEAGLRVADDPYQRAGGRDGFHTEHLGTLLAEMQWMDRSYPGMEW